MKKLLFLGICASLFVGCGSSESGTDDDGSASDEQSDDDDSAEDDSAEDDSAEDDSAEDDSSEDDDSTDDDGADDDSADDDSTDDDSTDDDSTDDDSTDDDSTDDDSTEDDDSTDDASSDDDGVGPAELPSDFFGSQLTITAPVSLAGTYQIPVAGTGYQDDTWFFESQNFTREPLFRFGFSVVPREEGSFECEGFEGVRMIFQNNDDFSSYASFDGRCTVVVDEYEEGGVVAGTVEASLTSTEETLELTGAFRAMLMSP